jgi:hypothetical protein
MLGLGSDMTVLPRDRAGLPGVSGERYQGLANHRDFVVCAGGLSTFFGCLQNVRTLLSKLDAKMSSAPGPENQQQQLRDGAGDSWIW